MEKRKLRIGQGLDIHPLVSGRLLILGGVQIPFDKGLDGHSDADVILHSVIDALLGAAGKPDIGSYFPNTEDRWKNARSVDLLKVVWEELSKEGWAVVNLDISVLAEAPKLLPHIPKMKSNIAEVLAIGVDAVGIKATTAEKLGFVGRGEGILASCVVLLEGM